MWSKYIIAFIVAVGLFLGLFFGIKHFPVKPDPIPDGMIAVKRSFLDSLQKVANMPPDTVTLPPEVIIDSVEKIVIHEISSPFVIDLPTGEKTYIDSLQMHDDGIDAWVKIKSQGIINQIKWGYRPVYKTVYKEITKPEPYPVEVFQDRPQRGLYFHGGVGAGITSPGFGLGLSWQQRNGLSYGVQVLQFENRYYMIQLGYKIF